MNKQTILRLAVLATLSPVFAAAQQQPVTQPSTRPTIEYIDPDVRSGFSPINGSGRLLKLRLHPEIGVPPNLSHVSHLGWRNASGPGSLLVRLSRADGQADFTSLERSAVMTIWGSHPVDLMLPSLLEQARRDAADGTNQAEIRRSFASLVAPLADQWTEQAVAELQALARSEGEITPERRRDRYQEIGRLLAPINLRIDVLKELTKAQPNAAARITETLRMLRERQQDLKIKLSAQEARRKAIGEGIDRLRQQAQVERHNDAVLENLRALLKLQEQKLDLIRAQHAAGVATASDVMAIEVGLIEARTRLAEREASMGKAGKGELMDRLTDELAMVAIDATDVQIQIQQLQDVISSYDPAALNARSLDALLENEPGFGTPDSAKLPPLYDELRRQQFALWREEFALMVAEIVPLDVQVSTFGGSGGRGGGRSGTSVP